MSVALPPKPPKKPKHHKCEFCGRRNSTVKWAIDPYESEIRNDWTKHWICDRCEQDHNMEV